MKPITHDAYIRAVARLAARSADASETDRSWITQVRLAYGDGPDGTMGITRYNKWKGADGKVTHWCAVCATTQPDGKHLLAETVLHELGHAVAGPGHGHGPVWQAACKRLGLVDAKATYQHGDRPVFSPWMLAKLNALREPTEGRPIERPSVTIPGLPGPILAPTPVIRPCGAGNGVRGGKSRGPGSGSRNVVHLCGCVPPIKVRAAISRKLLRARCLDCFQVFSPA